MFIKFQETYTVMNDYIMYSKRKPGSRSTIDIGKPPHKGALFRLQNEHLDNSLTILVTLKQLYKYTKIMLSTSSRKKILNM